MQEFDPALLKNLYVPPKDSHKGENGKLLLIGGSKLFHAASLWSLQIASRIVDMVFYSSVPENNAIVEQAKEEFRNGIVIPRSKIDEYIQEAECILIGPGLPRESGEQAGDDDTKTLTETLLSRYPDKKWVLDGGSLQVMNPELLRALKKTPILTPHHKEFDMLLSQITDESIKTASAEEQVERFAKEYRCIVLLKGEKDVICSPDTCEQVTGGNAGMTKGGTGDVLAGLVAALYCKNDAFLSAVGASYINKRAGEELFKKVGYTFNASDLANAIPRVMKELLSK